MRFGDNSASGAGSALLFSAAQIIVQSLVLFLTYRIAVIEIGLASLGLWSVASAAASFGRVGDMGFAGALPRLLAQGLGRETGRRGTRQTADMIETAVLSSTLGTLFLTALLTWPLMWFAGQMSSEVDQPLVVPLVVGADAALIVTALSITFLSCHDGIGNFRYRAIVAIGGNLISLAAVWILIGHLGALALPVSVIVQGLWSAALAWIGLRRRIPGLSAVPVVWSRTAFRELLAIGKFTQTNSILIILFEPLSRVLAGRLGGVEFAALFDLAAKVAGNIRLLFSSSAQAMVPFYAFIKDSTARTDALFKASSGAIAVLAAAVIALASLISPVLSLLALGTIRLDFLAVFWILLAGNLGSIIGGPAFSYALGAGCVAVTTRAFVVQAATFVIATLLTLPLFGGNAVAVAYGLGLALPGLYLIFAGPNLDAGARRRLLVGIARAVSPIMLVLLVAICIAISPDEAVRGILPWGLTAAITLTIADLGIRFGRQLIYWAKEINGYRIANLPTAVT